MSKIEEAMRRLEGEPALGALAPELGAGSTAPPRPGPSSTIARMGDDLQRTPKQLDAARLIYSGAKDSRTMNAFRQLRTTLLRRAGHRNFLLMVSGTTQRAGSSFVASNLGAAIALDETKTALVIDCNLRDPGVSGLAVSSGGEVPGLTDYLSGAEPRLEHIIHSTGVPRLRVVPTGSRAHAGTELFTGPKLRKLFQELLARYPDRYIIVDAPAITEYADARIVAELCHFVMLVVPYGRATVSQVEEAVAAVAAERFVGTVLNDTPYWPLQG